MTEAAWSILKKGLDQLNCLMSFSYPPLLTPGVYIRHEIELDFQFTYRLVSRFSLLIRLNLPCRGTCARRCLLARFLQKL